MLRCAATVVLALTLNPTLVRAQGAMAGKLDDGGFGDGAGGQHDPDDPGLFEFLDEISVPMS